MYETEAFEKWFRLGSGEGREMIHMEIENIRNFYLKSFSSPQNKSTFIFSPFKDSSWQIIFLVPHFDSLFTQKPPEHISLIVCTAPSTASYFATHGRANDSGWIDFFSHQFRLTILFPSITDGRKASNSVFFFGREAKIFLMSAPLFRRCRTELCNVASF